MRLWVESSNEVWSGRIVLCFRNIFVCIYSPELSLDFLDLSFSTDYGNMATIPKEEDSKFLLLNF